MEPGRPMSTIVPRTFSSLDLGISRILPYGAFAPESGKVWDRQNLVTKRGVLRPGWKWEPLTQLQPPLAGHSESRTVAGYSRDQAPISALLVSTPDGYTRAYIVLTDGEIFINRQSLNPTYTTAQTVTLPSPGASQGTVNFSAAAALRTRGIKPGDLFRCSKMQAVSESMWESVISVPDQQTLVITRNNYAASWDASWGSTAQTWEVRRTFRRSPSMGRAYMALSNGDLYVACECAGKDYSETAKSQWCILKIANALTSPQEATYILSTWDTTGSLSADSIVAALQEITGIQVSVDGRVVAATVEDALSFNRLRCTSPSDDSDWQGVSASFSDLQNATSKIFCLSGIADRLFAFTSDRIFVGIPTGGVTPPFAWLETGASNGTMWPRSVQRHPRGLVYLGTDGLVYLFNGDESVPVTDESVKVWTSGVDYEYTLFEGSGTVDVLGEDGPAASRATGVDPTVVIA